ncbi:MAG: aminoacyl-tRNA hydrolase [Phycisphaerae bacterium]|nr:aminoacyl-tRNA hydrolase [Phycisphaerae bacterium]|tara:strand:- start:843 stop:1280 length:438 start_codon:yes stop_codon:yes gene_type:complete
MSSPADLEVTDDLSIPGHELVEDFSRSSGPGGQHANKVETRVTLSFDVAGSSVLTEEQKGLLLERLASRINKNGILRVSCEESRAQAANRDLVRERFASILEQALATDARRIPTKATRASKRRRLDDKRRRGDVKRGRGGSWDDH